MSQENVELARRYLETFNEGGLDAAAQLWDPEIEIYDPPTFPDAGRHAGTEAARKVVESYLGLGWDGQFRDPEFLDMDDEVLVLWQARVEVERAGGVPMENTLGHVYLFNGDRVRRIRQYFSREEALSAAGLSK
jgi:ketosteroid isomerase-like protein